MRTVLLRLAVMSAVAACAAAPAQALDVLGLYVGGAIGQGQVQATAPSLNASDFKENHSAFKVVAGVRPISLFGVETANAEGFQRGRNLDKIGMEMGDTSELFSTTSSCPPMP